MFFAKLRPLPLLLLCVLLGTCGAPRQRAELSFTQLVRAGDDAEKNREYATAADFFRRAFAARPGEFGVLYRAAELFVRTRNYPAAADAYGQLPPGDDRWPLLGLKYGRMLKQSGRYFQAENVLRDFIGTYNGGNRQFVTDLARTQVRGIQLRKEQGDAPAIARVTRPGIAVNTAADEYGPSGRNAELLYFTGTAGGQGRLYTARSRAGAWQKAVVPEGFPVITAGTFGTGTLSADGRHFYFTICSGLAGEDGDNRCDIFYAERRGEAGWGQPRRLDAPVNDPTATNAYPHVTVGKDGRMTLYFASDRPGGRGGTDLYRAEVQGGNPLRFGPALPLGPSINSVGDERTPYYDQRGSGALFFASDGWPGFGGQDIFRAEPTPDGFGPAEHLALPLNSEADDYGLVLLAAGEGGFFTSNRSGFGRTATTDTDIFAFEWLREDPRLEASVYDQASGEELSDYDVTLYEVTGDGTERLRERKSFPEGAYTFSLRPGERYRVEISKAGYRTYSYPVVVLPNEFAVYGLPAFLKATGEGGTHRSSGRVNPGAGTTMSGGAVVTGGTTSPGITPPPTGISYRVQIAAVRKFSVAEPRYVAARALGTVRGEPIPGKKILRVTIGDFADRESAERAVRQARQEGYTEAFAVEYKDGKRQ